MITSFQLARELSQKWVKRDQKNHTSEFIVDTLALAVILKELKAKFPKAWKDTLANCPDAVSAPNTLQKMAAYILTIEVNKKEDAQ